MKNTGVLELNDICFATVYVFSQGHDYLGRSSGPSSLQVFTHHLSSVEYIADFVPQGSSATPVSALRIGAGTQLETSEHRFLLAPTFSHVVGISLSLPCCGSTQYLSRVRRLSDCRRW